MKNTLYVVAAVVIVGSIAPLAFAQTSGASFGSLGTQTGNTSTFGISVCNNGPTTITNPISMTVTANNVSVGGYSGSPITTGSCVYNYFPYSSFNMTVGAQYTVVFSSPGLASASYTAQVPGPGLVLGASIAVPQGAAAQNNIDLMASEVILMQRLISLIQMVLGR
ncbi:MAG: hypothetical protein ABR884_01020 [Minisyncoccia bacterium]|jgi:hypothetical protein